MMRDVQSSTTGLHVYDSSMFGYQASVKMNKIENQKQNKYDKLCQNSVIIQYFKKYFSFAAQRQQ